MDDIGLSRRTGSAWGLAPVFDLDEVAEVDVRAIEQLLNGGQVEAVDDVVGTQEAVGALTVTLDHLDPTLPVGCGLCSLDRGVGPSGVLNWTTAE